MLLFRPSQWGHNLGCGRFLAGSLVSWWVWAWQRPTVLLASRDDTDTTAQRSALAAARAKAKDKLSITEYDAAVFQAFRGVGIAV
jgi:hypothetical protein